MLNADSIPPPPTLHTLFRCSKSEMWHQKCMQPFGNYKWDHVFPLLIVQFMENRIYIIQLLVIAAFAALTNLHHLVLRVSQCRENFHLSWSAFCWCLSSVASIGNKTSQVGFWSLQFLRQAWYWLGQERKRGPKFYLAYSCIGVASRSRNLNAGFARFALSVSMIW